MEPKWTIFLMFVGPIAGVLIVATLVKYIEVQRARSWLGVPGRIVSGKAVFRPVRRLGADSQEEGEDTEPRNFADFVYEFEVAGKRREGTRISIADIPGTAVEFSTNFKKLPQTVKKGMEIRLDDGSIVLSVLKTGAGWVDSEVIVGGKY